MSDLPDRPDSTSAPAEPGLKQARERAVQQLSAHFAADHLEVAELERRLDLVYAARTRAAVDELLADLPALAHVADTDLSTAVAVEPWRSVPKNQTMVAVMGGADRKGQWTPPRHINVLVVMGGANLDFREAHFGEPVTEVTLVVFMGGVEIIVPPGVRVESNGFALMGGFDQLSAETAGPDAPLVKINGFVCMGGADVKVRLPGESARDARRRIRRERRRRELPPERNG